MGGTVGGRRVSGLPSVRGGAPRFNHRRRREKRRCGAIGFDDAERSELRAESVSDSSSDSSETSSEVTRLSSPWPLLDALDDAREVLTHDPNSKSKPETTMHWTLSDPVVGSISVIEAVAETAQVSKALAKELVDMGAVYVQVWPEGRGDVGNDGTSSASAFESFGWNPIEGVCPPATVPPKKKKEKWLRVRSVNTILEQGDRIRVHQNPRRYRTGCWLGASKWRARVVYEDENYFVVNKPARLPTQAHESNGCECVPGCIERSLGFDQGSLRVTHRLDASTSGIVVLGKHKNAVAQFNEAVANKKTNVNSQKKTRQQWRMGRVVGKEITDSHLHEPMTKTYIALTSGTDNLFDSPHLTFGSTVVHWQYPGPFGDDALSGFGLNKSQARFLRSENVDGEFVAVNGENRQVNWKKCELRIVDCVEIDHETLDRWHVTHTAALKASHKAPPSRWLDKNKNSLKPEARKVFQVTVELVTGRTHQVRSQLAALGHPLLGDSLYEPMRGYLHDDDVCGTEDEESDEESNDLTNTKPEKKDFLVSKRVAAGVVPDWPVALHASGLVWSNYRFVAPAPWAAPIDNDYHYL